MSHQRPPYVPWSFTFTEEAAARLRGAFGPGDLDAALGNHFLILGNAIGFFDPVGGDLFRDVFGVVWDRSVDRDIGVVRGAVLPEPSLGDYRFPNPGDPRFFSDIPGRIAQAGDRFRVFALGFSLYERAWTLRGAESLLMDFIDHPEFVRNLLEAITDYNLEQVREALKYDIDGVLFGDDWGQQRGIQMGPALWREFIRPCLRRMYAEVRNAGKFVLIHSCGDVDELFDDLIGLGVDCFNPFQPEVMDVPALLKAYRGRLAFHGGLSTQRTLPYGTPEDVRRETSALLQLGAQGGYILAPAHAVEGDVPLENLLALIETVRNQPGFTPARPT
jgi:uroporphyrinogen decarboxylase